MDEQDALNIATLMDGKIPPWLMRIVKKSGRTINKFAQIQSGDRILIGISGGKDSLTLALILALRKIWLPIDYSLEALLINWEEHPLTREQLSAINEFMSTLGITFSVTTEKMQNEGFCGDFNCYLCSRNRRRILFNWASKRSITKIALGHHLDDFAQTALMNLCGRAEVGAIPPVRNFFSGKLQVIRPLIELSEGEIKKIATRVALPVAKSPCPFDRENIRSKVGPIVKELCQIDPLAKEHMFKALHDIDLHTVGGHKA